MAGQLSFAAEVHYLAAIKALYIKPAVTEDLVDIVLVVECQMLTAWRSITPPPKIYTMTRTQTLEPDSFVAFGTFIFGGWQTVLRC